LFPGKKKEKKEKEKRIIKHETEILSICSTSSIVSLVDKKKKIKMK